MYFVKNVHVHDIFHAYLLLVLSFSLSLLKKSSETDNIYTVKVGLHETTILKLKFWLMIRSGLVTGMKQLISIHLDFRGCMALSGIRLSFSVRSTLLSAPHSLHLFPQGGLKCLKLFLFSFGLLSLSVPRSLNVEILITLSWLFA